MVVFVINILIVQVDILNYVLHIVLFVSCPSVSIFTTRAEVQSPPRVILQFKLH